jgi:hypothetical protein
LECNAQNRASFRHPKEEPDERPVTRQMPDGQGYESLFNGVPRTFRDKRETALEAAQFAKSRAKRDIIELRDCAIGEKLVVLADGRVGSRATQALPPARIEQLRWVRLEAWGGHEATAFHCRRWDLCGHWGAWGVGANEKNTEGRCPLARG